MAASSPGFAHQRLDAFRVALELADRVIRLSAQMPRGHAEIRSQLQRSALATVRHIAEGAARSAPADKRARFTIARGEVAECEATLQTAALLRPELGESIQQLRVLADRVGAMLTGLMRREDARVRGPGG